MSQSPVENGHEANGNGLVVQKRPDIAPTTSTSSRTRSSMSTMSSSLTTLRSSSFRGGGFFSKYGSQVDLSGEDVLEAFDTVEEALDAIAAERLRFMPHDGSTLDRIFKWATNVVGHINELSTTVETFVPNADETASLCWGNCLLLLQMGPEQTPILAKAFHTFQEITLELARFINKSDTLSSIPGVQGEIAGAYTDLVELISSVTLYYYRSTRGSMVISTSEFDARFGHHIRSFYTRKTKLTELMWSTAGVLQATSLKSIRELLSVKDSALPVILAGRRPVYAEFTCDWFASHLAQIKARKNGLSVITGAPGSGKTVLSQWIIDHLQTSTEDDYDVVSYRMYEDIAPTASGMAVVKGLLLQMLDRRIGDLRFLQALDNAVSLSASSATAPEVEDALWKAFRVAVKGASQLMIVVDGITALPDDRNMVSRVLQQLNSAAQESSQVKAIVLSRPLKKSLPQRTFQFSLEPGHVINDVRTVVLEALASIRPFSSLKIDDREVIAGDLVRRSEGSFLWPQLVLRLATQQRTVDEILSVVQTAPSAFNELMEQVFNKIDISSSETRSILAWLLAAQRPLFVHEIRALLETDTKKFEHVYRVGGVEDDIVQALGSLVTVNDGVVSFKHTILRHYVLGLAGAVADFSNSGKFPFHLKEAHYDLVIRSLAHAKCHVHEELEVTMTPLAVSTQTHFFRKYDLLEYTVRYWTTHFLASPMAEVEEYKLTGTFKQCISDSVLLALLEASCITSQYTLEHAELLQSTGFKIRKAVFGASALSVLQALVFQIVLSQRLQRVETLEYAYEAWTLGKEVFGFNSSVVKSCAEIFIHIFASTTEVTETHFSRQEELLVYLVDVAKEDRGGSHDVTIKYTRMLVQLYIQLQQIEKATYICKELYDISVSRYGQFSAETAEIGTILFEQLHHMSESETVQEIIETSHQWTIQTLDVTDIKRIDSTLSIVEIYEKRGDITKAEDMFFQLWQAITRVEQISEEIVEKQIRVALAYSEFLVRHSSKVEAENIVTTLWTSIERRKEFMLESYVSWAQTVSKHMRSMQWYSLAQSTLTSVWKKCQVSEESTHSETIAESLIETAQEATEETDEEESETTRTVTRTKRFEFAREAFRSLFSSNRVSKEVSISTLKTAETLVSAYAEEKEWAEAIHVSQMLLDQKWKGIEKSKQVVKLSKDIKETTTLALNLAVSYFETLQIEKATIVYENVFQSLLVSVAVEDELVSLTLRTAIEFYEKTYQFLRAIALYGDFISAIRDAHGEEHHLIVEINYALADLALRCHQIEAARQAYLHIFTIFTRDGVLHPHGINAAWGLCKIYSQQEKWQEAREVYAVLWTAITQHSKELQLEAEYIQEVYQSYVSILETRLEVEVTVIRELAYSYRETCIQLYGHEHTMTYKATVHLAEVSQQIEQYHEESIEMYEAALRYSEKYSEEETITETTKTRSRKTKTAKKTTIKQHLAEMYSKSETKVSRATELYQEDFKSVSAQYGYASQETLSSLQQLVVSYKKQSAITEAVETLQTFVSQIFTSETDTQKLTSAARTLANLYLEIEQRDTAISLYQSLRRRLVYESKTVSRKTTVFVVTFEEIITGESYTTIMADLVAEMHLYDAFLNISQSTKFMQAFITGVRLLVFQGDRDQLDEYHRTDTELFKIFAAYLHVADEADLRVFYHLCVEEVLQGDYELAIATRCTVAVHKYFEEGNFQAAFNLASLFHQFICQVDGFRSQAIVKQGFKLCKYLQGHEVKTTSDERLQAAMLGLSKSILADILQVYRTLGVRFTELEVSESNELALLLGEQRSFENLEFLLTDLWTSRIVQKTWSSDTIVTIGRRLVEARFSCGKTEQAIRLCSDICYNLRRVWGSFDRMTLELTTLLSELYTASGNYRAAMTVHERILRQLVTDGDISDTLSVSEAATIASKHTEFLKRAHQRLGGWDKEEHLYKRLVEGLNERFAGEKAWAGTTEVLQVEEWAKGEADELGTWRAPGAYGFLLVGGGGKEGQEVKRPAHQNQLRKGYSTSQE
ncbi:hypothetical protein FE257_001325 [Aspergillus nanangensis]|uniref:Nephrocystin 3-like N-terminal domain-containing protein n=1 Tax=Aspergillus nanangensis TaxID=2582783 RepID=A0AAD4GPQ4_ASPNN|nr:hypothetical protein FE257_001325 [Aspergillus nanangensis]